MREMNGENMDAVNIKSWFDLMGLSPHPWEVQAVSGITRKLNESRL